MRQRAATKKKKWGKIHHRLEKGAVSKKGGGGGETETEVSA